MFTVKRLSVFLLAVVLVMSIGTLALGQGVLKVATEAGFMPFEYVDAQSGELLGFDMDLIRAIGQELGLEVEIDNISWDGLIPALLNNNYDAVIAGLPSQLNGRKQWTSQNPTLNRCSPLWPRLVQRTSLDWKGMREDCSGSD